MSRGGNNRGRHDPDKVYQGNPCKYGHPGLRYKKGGQCVGCACGHPVPAGAETAPAPASVAA